MNTEKFFVAGGTLHPNSPSYVARPADDALYTHLLAGDYCYVLTTRQMGKSSLMARAKRRLQQDGVRTAYVDLTTLGTSEESTWYLDLIGEIAEQLDLDTDPVTWWQARTAHGPVRRFIHFLREVVLAEVQAPVVLAVDELDFTLGLPFSDTFLAAVRALYNARADDPRFARLTVVLIGVVTPTDLIKDPSRTPFNIGEAIDLQGFDRAAAQTLQAGWDRIPEEERAAVLDRILYWTGGHPYLTQKLCLAVAESGAPDWPAEKVDALVAELFFAEGPRSEQNLKFVQGRIDRYARKGELLRLYRRVYQGKVVPEDPRAAVQNELKLAGLARVEGETLQVHNEIYRRVFDEAWIRATMPREWAIIMARTAAAIAILAVGILLYNFVLSFLSGQYYQKVSSYQTPPSERFSYLARIFRLRGFLVAPDYTAQGKDLFFNLPASERAALYHNASERDLLQVTPYLYTTLADTEVQNDTTTAVLTAMLEALNRLEDQDEQGSDLQKELTFWLQGREAYRNSNYEAALANYERALKENPDNPATRYELARVQVLLGDYTMALGNLEWLMGQAQIAPVATVTPVPASPAPATIKTRESIEITPTATPQVMLTETITPGTAPTQTYTLPPVALPTPQVTVPDFRNNAYIRDAVKNLIALHPDLVTALARQPMTSYPHLRAAWWYVAPTATRDADNMVMVYVPAGEFQMGSTDEQVDIAVEQCVDAGTDRYACEDYIGREQPVHTVILDAFWLDQTEVTNAQYVAYLNQIAGEIQVEDEEFVNYRGNPIYDLICSGCETWGNRIVWDGTQFSVVSGYEDHPVILVSWYGARDYCSYVGGFLPTEAQWEYAARGPEGNIYPWGPEFDCARGNFDDETELDDYVVPGGAGCDGYDKTAPVGSFPEGASWVGALDLAGNVWEWTQDWYGADYYSVSPERNPPGPEEGDFRVVRGGGWNYESDDARAASRFRAPPDYRGHGVGVRCGAVSPGN